ncbi:MAG: thiamine pyrophosphate-requiring protein [Candidatus Rokubacteria bacterium]|nr:thiamine pyrophosphate-requiring protein [Candidatus Rokubacteria bacterium]
MLGKTAIVNILKLEGVEYIICYPSNAIIDAAAAASIRPILARTERVMVNIADGVSRVSGGQRIGVCVMQHGPGSENAFSGVAQAYSDNSPILLLPGTFDRRRLGVPPNFQGIYNYRDVTKWVEMVNFADRIPQMMRRAFTLLRSGCPGPVMLEVPTDVMNEEIPDEAFQYAPVKGSRPPGDPQDVREAITALLAARAPVIVAGQGIFYAEAWEELRKFAELVQVPVLTTLNGKSAFPEDHPLALGAGGRSGPKTVDHFLREADLVFGVGTSFTRSNYIVPIPRGKTMVQVTIDERDINKDYPVSFGVIGDARAVLCQLTEEVVRQTGPSGRRGDESAAREVRAVKEEFLKEWMPRLTSDERPISPYRVIWELMHTADRRRTIVTHDSGNPRDQMVPFYEAIIPHGYIGWGKSTQLGTGLGLVIGAKLAAPDKLVVNLMGDAAFGMVGMDFETAVRSKIPILTIVMNNGLMGGYEKHLPVSTARYGTRFLSGDYAKVAEGLGGYTERVEKPQDLVPALRRAIEEVEAGRATLLEVITREEPLYPTYW